MSSKFQNSLAQLHKLHNQIRLELNQIRPFKDRSFKHQNAVKVSQKKLGYYNRSHVTSGLLPEKHQAKVQRKKLIESQTIPHWQFDRSLEKKHFARHYNASVSTQMDTKRTKSNYLNIKSSRALNNRENNHGTSLLGIGQTSRMRQKSRPSIRLFSNQYIRSIGKSPHRKKSLFD